MIDEDRPVPRFPVQGDEAVGTGALCRGEGSQVVMGRSNDPF
jgi:hypothetical protein